MTFQSTSNSTSLPTRQTKIQLTEMQHFISSLDSIGSGEDNSVPGILNSLLQLVDLSNNLLSNLEKTKKYDLKFVGQFFNQKHKLLTENYQMGLIRKDCSFNNNIYDKYSKSFNNFKNQYTQLTHSTIDSPTICNKLQSPKYVIYTVHIVPTLFLIRTICLLFVCF